MFSCGIVGLPNAGKSTLFNAMTGAGAEVADYPFCTIEPNIGVLAVPDERLRELGRLLKPQKLTPAAIELFDIAGLVRGAGMGEGLGNEFLGHIQQVDSLIHLVRLFPDENVAHVDGFPQPGRDIRTVNNELLIRDMAITERRLHDARKKARTGGAHAQKEAEFLQKIFEGMQDGNFLSELDIGTEEMPLIREMGLLTVKPVIYVGNVSENQVVELGGDAGKAGREEPVAEMEKFASENGLTLVFVCAKLECELAELNDEEEANMFLAELGLDGPGTDRIVEAAYRALGLITFFTVKGPETRAWELQEGGTAQQAAGRIHSDMERGFIRAEVAAFDHLLESGSFAAAREKGCVRAEGKDYVVRDGDIILFRFVNPQ